MMGKPGTEVVEVELRYGSGTRRCHVPRRNLAEVLEPRRVEATLREETTRLKEALDEPIGTPRLEEMVQPDDQVALVVDDMARPTPISRILPAVLDRLSRAGVADGQITVVIALGTHRPMTPAEIETRIGPGILRRVRVENHDFQDRGRLAYVGESSDGIPVWINRRVKEASFRIAVGNIVPHGVAGWAGGGKIIYPGVAEVEGRHDRDDVGVHHVEEDTLVVPLKLYGVLVVEEVLLRHWHDSALLKETTEEGDLELTANGSWFAGNMIAQLATAMRPTKKENNVIHL